MTMSTMPALALSRASPGRRGEMAIGAAAVLLVLAVLVSLAVGPVLISPGNVLAILWNAAFGVRSADGMAMRDAVVVLDIRLPRTVLTVLVGASLAVAGAVLQGVFRNPLADPALVGVSTGAAFAAVLWIVFGYMVASYLPGILLALALPIAAFVGSLVSTILLYRLATREGRTSVAMLLFSGIALSGLAAAGTGLVIFIASDQQLREFTFWTLGSAGGASWTKVIVVVPFSIALLAGAVWIARGLDALALGEAEAFHIGIDTQRLKRLAIVLVAAGVGAAVAVAGVIGFVGLVIPHLLRLTAGPMHRRLIIGCALLGGALLTGSDIIARTVAAPAEVPIGVVTAILGAPYFMYLIHRNRAALGG